jgi:hypothetical protein
MLLEELQRQISSHKCSTDQVAPSKNTPPTNSFLVSIYETQGKLEKAVNNILLCFMNLQSFAVIASRVDGGGFDNYLEGSFREEIKNIEEAMEKSIKYP